MDDIPLGILFFILIGLLCCSAFFSGSETALMALNRYRMQHLAQSGHRGAIYARRLLRKPDRLIGLILVGNNIANILITQLATFIGYRLYNDIGVAIATGLLTLGILIFGEVTPKTIGAVHSDKIAYPAAFVYIPLMTLAWPLVWGINLIANTLLRLMGVQLENSDSTALSREELRTVVNQANLLIPRKHRRMLLGILDLEKATVEDIMIPRNEVAGLDLNEDWDDIVRQIKGTGYTRLPVFRGGIDNVIGFVHMRKVLHLIIDDKLTCETLESVIRSPYFIPEGTSLNRQLLNFQRERRRVGLVVDEYGDIQGLVTLEDLLEEIVGEFTTDPSTVNNQDITPQEDGSYLVGGGAAVRELNRALGWALDTSGPKTVNGLILEHLEAIPEAGVSVLIDGHPIEIVQTRKNAVKTVIMSPRLPQYAAEPEVEG